MGDPSFTEDKIQESRDRLVLFVLDLFKEKVQKDHTDMPGETVVPLGVAQETVKDNIEVGETEEDDKMFMMGLMQAGASVPVPVQGYSLEMMMEDFKNKIQEEFLTYVDYCKKINWKELLAKHGTEKYHKLHRDNDVNEQKLNVNPRYTRALFDVVGWWKDTGCKLFPKLAVAALIVLAKATHNGYQERVFSIGTFLDTKQQKRREERHYEMDVLQRINSDLMQEEEYWKEYTAHDPSHSDKEIIEGFFKITDQVKEKQVTGAPAEAKDDDDEEGDSVTRPGGPKRDSDEVSEDASVTADEETDNRGSDSDSDEDSDE